MAQTALHTWVPQMWFPISPVRSLALAMLPFPVVRVVLGIPLCVGMAFVVVGSPNAGVGLVGVVSGVPIRVGLVVTVVGSPKADVGPATFWDPTPVSGSLRRLGCLRVASWLASF